LCRHSGHQGGRGVIAFSPDGKLMASAGGISETNDSLVHLWETVTGRLIRRFAGHHSGVSSLAFSPDGLKLASGGGDSTILVWDITGRRANVCGNAKPLTPRQLDDCWTALANEDAAKAYDAVWASSNCLPNGRVRPPATKRDGWFALLPCWRTCRARKPGVCCGNRQPACRNPA
jgi:WD40 repeat protein